MPIHPAPPQDLPGKVEAFRQTVQAVIDLGRGLSEEQLALPTDCPGWTVHDQLAHVAAEEAELEGLRAPEVHVEGDHIRNELGALVERGVVARRERSGEALVRELEYLLERRMASLSSPGLELDSLVPGLGRPMPVGEVLRIRTLDIWAHEQDIREAIGKPGDLDSPAATVFVATSMSLLPKAVARTAKVPAGDTVIIELTGPVTGREGIRVEQGDDGPVGIDLFGDTDLSGSGSAPATTATLPAIGDTQITTIKLSTEAFGRLSAGRRTPEDVTWNFSGDEDTARRVLTALVFTP